MMWPSQRTTWLLIEYEEIDKWYSLHDFQIEKYSDAFENAFVFIAFL
jgi:hypothetical protein